MLQLKVAANAGVETNETQPVRKSVIMRMRSAPLPIYDSAVVNLSCRAEVHNGWKAVTKRDPFIYHPGAARR